LFSDEYLKSIFSSLRRTRLADGEDIEREVENQFFMAADWIDMLDPNAPWHEDAADQLGAEFRRLHRVAFNQAEELRKLAQVAANKIIRHTRNGRTAPAVQSALLFSALQVAIYHLADAVNMKRLDGLRAAVAAAKSATASANASRPRGQGKGVSDDQIATFRSNHKGTKWAEAAAAKYKVSRGTVYARWSAYLRKASKKAVQ
jgi:hypothetical protein